MNELLALKHKYNKLLERNKKAEEYFKIHTVKECEKYLELFNEVTRDLSITIKEFKYVYGLELTDHEILYGFEEVK